MTEKTKEGFEALKGDKDFIEVDVTGAYVRAKLARVDELADQVGFLKDHVRLYQAVHTMVVDVIQRVNVAAGLQPNANEKQLVEKIEELKKMSGETHEKLVGDLEASLISTTNGLKHVGKEPQELPVTSAAGLSQLLSGHVEALNYEVRTLVKHCGIVPCGHLDGNFMLLEKYLKGLMETVNDLTKRPVEVDPNTDSWNHDVLKRTRATLGAHKDESVDKAAERVVQDLENQKVASGRLMSQLISIGDAIGKSRPNESAVEAYERIAGTLEEVYHSLGGTGTGLLRLTPIVDVIRNELEAHLMRVQSQLALPDEEESVEQAFSRIRRGVGKLKEKNTKLQTTVTEMEGRIKTLHESLEAGEALIAEQNETIKQLRANSDSRSKRITELENALTAVIRDPKMESPDVEKYVKKFSDIIKRATQR